MAKCPICQELDTCRVDNLFVACVNTPSSQKIPGYKAAHEAVFGKGWVWEPVKQTPDPLDIAVPSGKPKGLNISSVSDSLEGTKVSNLTPDPFAKHSITLFADGAAKNIAEVINILGTEENHLQTIYVQGSDQGQKWPARLLTTPEGKIRMVDQLTVDKTIIELEKRFSFFKLGKKPKDSDQTPLISAPCPERLAKNFLSEGNWHAMKGLEQVAKIPLLQWDGSINSLPGYYPDSKTIIDLDPSAFRIISDPTKTDAWKSMKALKHFLREFHFKDLLGHKDRVKTPSVDRSAAIAALLTAVSRHLYDYAPCFITNAHTPGSGKGALASVITTIQDGAAQSERTWDSDPVELNKVILSELINQPPSLVIGNIDSKFGGAIVESMLTKTHFPGRILGSTKMVYPSTKTLFMANGNNLTISKDMIRRTILIRLDCGVEKPEEIEYEVKDIVGYAKEHRFELFEHAMVILQSWIRSADYKKDRAKLNGFEEWDKVVRGAILWLDEADPVASQNVLHEDDEEGIRLARFITAYREEFGNAEKTPSEMIMRAEGKEAVFRQPNIDYLSILREIASIKNELSSTRLGMFLQKYQGQVKEGYCIERMKRKTSGRPWRVKKMELTEQGEDDVPF